MKAINWSILSFFIWGCYACNSVRSYENVETFGWDDFTEAPIALKGDSLAFDDILMKPIRITLVDSFLIMRNQNVEFSFHIYNLHTLKKTGERIPFGVGPDEMIEPIWMCMPDGNLGVFDRNKSQLDIYPGHSLLVNDSVKPVRRISFDEQLLNMAPLPEGGFLSSTLQSEDNKFALFDREGKRLSYFGDYSKMQEGEMSHMEKINAFMGNIVVKPDGSRWVMTHKSTDLLEFYDNRMNLIKRIQGPDGIMPDVRQEGGGIHRGKEGREAYFSPFATDKYIYVLYDGRVYDWDSPTRYLHDKILVFDWEGNPVRYYTLSDPIFHFAVDSERGIIYGLSDYPDFHITAFRFNK